MLPPADVPPFKVYFPKLSQMDTAQRAFYDRLSRALDNGTKLEVVGNVSYLFVYAYELVADWEDKGFAFIHDGLRQLEKLYPEETKFSEGCRIWALDCLLATRQFDAYLAATELMEPSDVFRKATHLSNLRCNVAYLAGRPAAAEDLVRMSEFKASTNTKNHPAESLECLRVVVASAADQNGPWLDRCVAMQLKQFDVTIFQGAPITQPLAPFKQYSFYAVPALLEGIVAAAKMAQVMLRQVVRAGKPPVREL